MSEAKKFMSQNMFIGNADYQHGSKSKIGILLTNLGTPDAPTKKALRRYLKEFLWDKRVIEITRWRWWLILNLFILNTRPARIAKVFKGIWTDQGSPLLVITNKQAASLRASIEQKFANNIVLEVGMRYGNPSIAGALKKLSAQGAEKILVLPLYGQYFAGTAGTTFDAVVDELKKWRWVPEIHTVMQFHDHPAYIECLASSISKHWEKNGRAEKLLMSFHGIPKRYFFSGDPYFCHCHKTARLVAEKLNIKEDEYVVSFQSVFGKEEWIKPATDKTFISLAKNGIKSVDVLCPGFLADCLETLEEIEVENRDYFLKAGGEKFSYIPALNDREDFIQALVRIVEERIQPWLSIHGLSVEKNQNLSNQRYEYIKNKCPQ